MLELPPGFPSPPGLTKPKQREIMAQNGCASPYSSAKPPRIINNATDASRPINHPNRHTLPPPGCAPDAIKLFIGNLSKHCTESHLLPLLESVGKVVELAITRDKATRASKGSAFVWYATAEAAEAAIKAFNKRHVLDITSPDALPLAVRPATIKASTLRGGYSRHPRASKPHDDPQQQRKQQHLWPTATASPTPSTTVAQHVVSPPISSHQHQHQQQPVVYLPIQESALPTTTELYLDPPPPTCQLLHPPAAEPHPPLPPATLKLALPTDQLAAISAHLYTIHAVSGAQLVCVPLPGAMASLVVSGSVQEVARARQMLARLVARAASG